MHIGAIVNKIEVIILLIGISIYFKLDAKEIHKKEGSNTIFHYRYMYSRQFRMLIMAGHIRRLPIRTGFRYRLFLIELRGENVAREYLGQADH